MDETNVQVTPGESKNNRTYDINDPKVKEMFDHGHEPIDDEIHEAMDNRHKVNTLAEGDLEQVLDALKESADSPSNKMIAELPSNNGVTEAESGLEGYSEMVNVSIDPETGASTTTPISEEDEDALDPDMSFDELVERATSKEYTPEKVEITAEDIAEEAEKNDMLGGLNLSDEDTIQIMRITNRVQNKEEFNIYKELPDSVKNAINKYIADAGLEAQTYTPRVNSIRNDLADVLINEFLTNISINKYTEEFQRDMNTLQNKVNEEFSKMYMDYDKNRTDYINKIMENEEDEEKKRAIGGILDAINDGFKLERIKEAARHHKIRIKKFDLEKPKRAFDGFLYKYYKQHSLNIYSIYTAAKCMERHFKDVLSEEDVLMFFIAICKYCLNYNPEVPQEHAFMYYAMYNAVLLDVYKGKEYEEFSSAYLDNVVEVVQLLKYKGDNSNGK